MDRGSDPRILPWGRRAIGLLLVALVVFPVYRLLDPRITGLAGSATVGLTDISRGLLTSGTLLLLIPALLAARFLSPARLEHALRPLVAHLADVPARGFALALALLSAVLVALFSRFVLLDKPNLIDAMAQLVEARYLAHGRLAGPAGPLAGFWLIQNMVVTPAGWVAQYPPGHALLLALGFLLHAPWLVGPVLAGATSLFVALALDRLLPGRRALARFAALLAALSPLALFLAGAYMNHVTAAACSAAALYFALRARDGHWAWALLSGVCGGWLFITRPLSAISVGAVPVLAIWIFSGRHGVRWWAVRLAAATAAALPFGLAMAAWNLHFFGDPFRFGYIAALGPAHQLGLHTDPWGNRYGPRQALAYTSADLTSLSLYLLETPFPLVALIGVYLMLARRLTSGEAVLGVWAITPVLANAFYWFHGRFMGPRLLAEAAPAWAALAAVACVGLVRMLPVERRTAGLLWPRSGLAAALIVVLVAGLLIMAPQRALSYGGGWLKTTRVPPPTTRRPGIVFVHGGWTARIASRLAARGMQLDSIETALRQNPTCTVQGYLDALQAGSPPPALSFRPRAANLPPEVTLVESDRIRVRPGEVLSPVCLRQAKADRYGIFPLAPLLWQGRLPGLGAGGDIFVRDLGPRRNEELLRRYPGRTAYVFMSDRPTAEAHLEPYRPAMRRLWGAAGGLARGTH